MKSPLTNLQTINNHRLHLKKIKNGDKHELRLGDCV